MAFIEKRTRKNTEKISMRRGRKTKGPGVAEKPSPVIKERKRGDEFQK